MVLFGNQLNSQVLTTPIDYYDTFDDKTVENANGPTIEALTNKLFQLYTDRQPIVICAISYRDYRMELTTLLEHCVDGIWISIKPPDDGYTHYVQILRDKNRRKFMDKFGNTDANSPKYYVYCF